jgi:hypothetical protein
MHIASLLSAAILLSATSFFGPPHITVRPITSTAAGVTFELDVEHHTTPEDLMVAGRAEGVRDGRRVSVPLTITRKSVGHFAVARQWDAGVPWVLVFSAEQGPNGTHGVVEGIVLLEANGAVKSIEYTKPGFHETSNKPLRVSSAKIDAALKTLGVTVSMR